MTTYTFDATGLATTNLIVNEKHSVFENNYEIFDYIVPDYAPFYAQGLVLQKESIIGVVTPMILGTDYTLCFNYLAATNSTTLPIYGGIVLLGNFLPTDVVNIVSYQTLGGEWCADISSVLQNVLNSAYNPRIVSWDQVTNVQQTFPTIPGIIPLTDVTGMSDLINAINNISTAIANKPANNIVFTYGKGIATTYQIQENDDIPIGNASSLNYYLSNTNYGTASIPDPIKNPNVTMWFSCLGTEQLTLTCPISNAFYAQSLQGENNLVLLTGMAVALTSNGQVWLQTIGSDPSYIVETLNAATNATQSATAAATSATNSATLLASITDKLNSISFNETTSLNAATSASTSATTATTQATLAATLATSASTSATNAAQSLTYIGNSLITAASAASASSNSATSSSTYATNALTSANAAASSATSAVTSLSSANTAVASAILQAGYASTSATAAATSASSSATSAINSTTSALSASTSATSAAASASTATTQATAASTSATNAYNSATATSNFVSTASGCAMNALTQATAAAASATSATNSATSASTSATNAAASATAASNSAALALAAIGNASTLGGIPAANYVIGGTVFNNQTGTSYTTILSDGLYAGSQGTLMTFNNTANQSVIIPPNSSVAYPVGTVLNAMQLGTGKVTFVAGNGVTLNSAGNFLSIGSQYVIVSLLQYSINVWVIIGSLMM